MPLAQKRNQTPLRNVGQYSLKLVKTGTSSHNDPIQNPQIDPAHQCENPCFLFRLWIVDGHGWAVMRIPWVRKNSGCPLKRPQKSRHRIQ